MSDEKEKFWTRMDGIKAGMLGMRSDSRLVPMSHYADADQNSLWFITANGTDLVDAVHARKRNAEYVIADGSEGLYARIDGQLSLSDDMAKLDEIWNVVASSWFEDGKRDDDVRLLRFSLTEGEIWATSGSSVAFLYEIAKAKVTGAKPDMGEHFTLKF